MALSSKRTRLTEEALEKVHKLIDSHGGIVKKKNSQILMWIIAAFWILWNRESL